ncbi:MAG TPA: hypothetical protein VNR11_20730 [Xanthobacteraceae bacterium]|nr:hypothetical protein [Xanthobacteraceae bacterium]
MSVSGIAGRTGMQIQSMVAMRRQLEDLYRQLGTGERSSSYAGLGLDRGLSMALRGQVAAIDSFKQTATIVGTRLEIAQSVLTQIDDGAHEVKRLTATPTFTFGTTGQTNDQQTAYGQLDQILGSLNARVGDQYLFSGKSPDVMPVENIDRILGGVGPVAGLKQIIAERKLADLGTSGLGRLTLPPIVTGPATLAGTGAAILPDAPATVTGTQDLSAPYASPGGGTLVINGTSVTINPGDNGAAVLAAINAPAVVAATGVTAALDPGTGGLVLTANDDDASFTIGAGSTLLAEFGLAATTHDPTNLITQGAVTPGDTLTFTIGANPPLTVTFGTNEAAVPPQVSTLAELNAQLATLVGGGASAAGVNLATGDISITATGISDSIAVTGTANAAAFGLATTTAAPTNMVTLAEDAAGHPFGMKLLSYNSNLAGATVTTGGPPASYGVNFGANPAAGQQISFSFTLPDGTVDSFTLTATTASPPGAGEFTIGATADVTAANFRGALNTAVAKLADTSLTAASAMQAANNFFNIDDANPPLRVAGPPFDTATALVAGTSADTLFWYKGEAGAASARSTAYARVDTSITINYGMRANEQAVRTAVASVAVFASMTFSPSDPNAIARYQEMAQRVGANLSAPQGTQRISDIQAEVANAQTVMKAASDRHQQASSALSGMLETVAGVSTEQAGAELLAVQTRLQASMQVTAMLSQVSLVNYLR